MGTLFFTTINNTSIENFVVSKVQNLFQIDKYNFIKVYYS